MKSLIAQRSEDSLLPRTENSMNKYETDANTLKEISEHNFQKEQYEDKSLSYASCPLIWGVPKKTGARDHFIYSGKTDEKIVYKPFTAIHQYLIDANWRLRLGTTHSDGPNYLIAYIVFTISNQPHSKKPGEHYQGGRTYIGFPVIAPFTLLLSNTPIEKQSVGSIVGGIGKFESSTERGSHSELALKEFLVSASNVENVVTLLKKRVETTFGSSKDFKVYGVDIFINSNKSICQSCESLLHQLSLPPLTNETPTFLGLLKTELEKQEFKTLTHSNRRFPRVFISVSSYEQYAAYCSNRFDNDVRKGFEIERGNLLEMMDMDHELPTKVNDYPTYDIDTKLLAGKVILSTPEARIDLIKGKVYTYNKYIKAQQTKYQDLVRESAEFEVPFQGGFCSIKGISSFLPLGGESLKGTLLKRYKIESNRNIDEDKIKFKVQEPRFFTETLVRAPITLEEISQSENKTNSQTSTDLKRQSNTTPPSSPKRLCIERGSSQRFI